MAPLRPWPHDQSQALPPRHLDPVPTFSLHSPPPFDSMPVGAAFLPSTSTSSNGFNNTQPTSADSQGNSICGPNMHQDSQSLPHDAPANMGVPNTFTLRVGGYDFQLPADIPAAFRIISNQAMASSYAVITNTATDRDKAFLYKTPVLMGQERLQEVMDQVFGDTDPGPQMSETVALPQRAVGENPGTSSQARKMKKPRQRNPLKRRLGDQAEDHFKLRRDKRNNAIAMPEEEGEIRGRPRARIDTIQTSDTILNYYPPSTVAQEQNSAHWNRKRKREISIPRNPATRPVVQPVSKMPPA